MEQGAKPQGSEVRAVALGTLQILQRHLVHLGRVETQYGSIHTWQSCFSHCLPQGPTYSWSYSCGDIQLPLRYYPEWILPVWMFREETWVFTHLHQPRQSGVTWSPLQSRWRDQVLSFSSFPLPFECFRSKTPPSAEASKPHLVDTGPLELVEYCFLHQKNAYEGALLLKGQSVHLSWSYANGSEPWFPVLNLVPKCKISPCWF